MKKVISITSVMLAFAVHADRAIADDAANWSIEPAKSCNSITVTLPSPTLNLGCDLDSDSGNPSSWFNPMASCSMDFDLIGLPSLGDIAAGLVGQVCSEIKAVKEQTIDKVIDDINDQIPTELFDDIDLNLDLTDRLNLTDRINAGEGTTGTPRPPSIDPNAPPTEDVNGDEMCFTKDSFGKTMTVPCGIADIQAAAPNLCYLNEGDTITEKWTPIACDRPTIDYEICVNGYVKDDDSRQIERYADGVPKVTLASCSSLNSNSTLDNACYDTFNGSRRIVECNRVSEPETQHNRVCTKEENGSIGGNTACINVDETCYGHLDGVFRAASCKAHTLNQERINPQGAVPQRSKPKVQPSTQYGGSVTPNKTAPVQTQSKQNKESNKKTEDADGYSWEW